MNNNLPGSLRDKSGCGRAASVGLSPARATILKKRLRELDSQIGKIDSKLFPIHWQNIFDWQIKLVEKRRKLDEKRLKVRNELKYGKEILSS